MIAFLMGMFFSTQAADHVKGNGKLSTKKITIDDFNAIKFDGVIDFNYEQSESTPLTVGFKGAKVDHFTKFIVKTNSKWLKEVKASGNANFIANSPLKGDELKINANSNCLVQLKQKVEVGKLDLNVSGSANMVVNELKTDKLECSINGSGTINLKAGNAEEADYSITTDGEIMAFGVAVPEVNCKITGKGSAQIHPTDNLKATIVGKGNIRYKGPTAVQQKVIGKGTVEEVK